MKNDSSHVLFQSGVGRLHVKVSTVSHLLYSLLETLYLVLPDHNEGMEICGLAVRGYYFPLQPILLSALWYLKVPLPFARYCYAAPVLLHRFTDLITLRKHLLVMLERTHTPMAFVLYAYRHDRCQYDL